MCVIVWRDDERITVVKGNDGGGWSSDGVVLWLGRMQNGYVIEWWREWSRLRWPFYNSEGWESGGLRRVADGDGVNSMLQFHPEREDDGTNHYRKMKRRQWARLGSMERKRDTAPQHGDIGRRRVDTGEEKGRRRCQLDWHESYWTKK
jgi:hypothetical protein